MSTRLPFFFILYCVIILALLHFAGVYLELYWRLPGYDKLAHLLGGFLAAFTVLSFVFIKQSPHVSKRQIISVGVLAAFSVGIAWELFELQAGITALSDTHYYINNGGDVFFDIVGGVAGVFYFIKKIA